MRRKIKCIVALACSLMLMVSNSVLTLAAENNDITKYEQRLQGINEQLGTQYKIPNAQESEAIGGNYQDVVDFYTALSMEEFEQYIYQMYEMDKNDSSEDFQKITMEAPAVEPRGIEQQNYYYSSSSNYLFIKANVITVSGVKYYNSVQSYGSSAAYSYPYYKPMGFSYTPLADSRQLKCSFRCSKYLSSNLIDTAVHTLTVTFTAGGGNVG